MAQVAQKYQDELTRLKECVIDARKSFEKNFNRYHESRDFVYNTSISARDKDILDDQGKPDVEFNIQEAHISRMVGEFYDQEPSTKVTANDDDPVDPKIIEVVSGHLRHLVSDFNSRGGSYNSFKGSMSGGFDVWKLWNDYSNPMSFHQIMKWERVYDPTLTGFDPMAKHPTKMDGNWCFELYPKRKLDFKREYPEIDINEVKFIRSMEGFSFSYSSQKEDILLICDFYEKKKKRIKIVELANGKVIPLDDYKDYIEQWKAAGHIEQPADITNERWTEIINVCRYRFIENKVIAYDETIFEDLPLIFVDGNSIDLRRGVNGEMYQMTRPYVHHSMGIQRLLNYAGQTLGNELENMVTSKFIAPIEGIPANQMYLEAYLKPQKPNTMLFNDYDLDDRNKKLTPPREIMRQNIPQEVSNTFFNAPQIMQATLGCYDTTMGRINNNQISGEAIFQGATQSNAAAKPYIIGYLEALNQALSMQVKAIPKIYVGKREIPVIGLDRKKSSAKINQKDGTYLKYSSTSINVKVEAGVNFQLQKNRSQQQMIMGMQASPAFSQFINTKCLPEFVKTFDMEGIDAMVQKAEQFQDEMAKMQQQQMQAQQQQMQNNPAVMRNQIEAQKLQQSAQQNQVENQLKSAQLQIDKLNADNARLKILAELKQGHEDNLISVEKLQTEKAGQAVDLAMKMTDQHHQHSKDAMEMHHTHTKEAIELHHKITSDIRKQDHEEMKESTPINSENG